MKLEFLIATLFLFVGATFAQNAENEPEPAAIIELGGVTNWNLRGGTPSFGPDFALEFTPIENWLEIEVGATPLFTRQSTEWDTDLLIKKPWTTLSKKAEVMIGVGPEWVHISHAGRTGDSIAGEAALDFMFWPSARHTFGWFVEPAYEYDFGPGHEQALGMSGGLLIAIPNAFHTRK